MLPPIRRASLGFIAVIVFSSRVGYSLPAAEYSLGKGAPTTSLAGKSDSDVYLMRDDAVFRFDGKRAVKTKNQPVCVATYPQDQATYPVNVGQRDAEIEARKYRARPPNAEEDYRWQPVKFTTLANEGGVIRVYGSGDQLDMRGSVRRGFSARLRGDAWVCEGWSGAEGGAIFELAYDGESTFASTENYASAVLYQDPDTYPFAQAPGSIIGVTAAGIHGVWAWNRESPTAYHLDGFSWDIRRLETWASVARVLSAGPGRAYAIGSTSQTREDNTTEFQSDAFAFWNGRTWVSIALPAGFNVQPRGLLVESPDRVLLVGEKGQYNWYERGVFRPDTGPQIRITTVWRSPSQRWFLGGQCGDKDCLVKIGGLS